MARITEIKSVKIDAECKTEPVYIAWIGTNGGWNYWLFNKIQTHGLLTENGALYNPYQENIEDSKGNAKLSSKAATPQIIVGAVFDKEDLGSLTDLYNPGIRGLLISPSVLMLINNDTWQTDGCKWRIAIVQPGSFKILDTDKSTNQIEIILNLPQINIQNQ